jgi:hypothetical protein
MAARKMYPERCISVSDSSGSTSIEAMKGCVAEGLLLLRRVDPCDADSVLHLVGVEDGDRIAVGNLDDDAFEDAGCRVGG